MCFIKVCKEYSKKCKISYVVVSIKADGHGWTAVHGKIQPLWFSGPLMPSCTALEDCRLPSDDDNTDDEESDSEVDLAFDEYTMSKSESDNE